MSKQAEIEFLARSQRGDPEVLSYAQDKPFSDAECGLYMMSLGAVLQLLPAPPARLLDLGCGPGWTSSLLALRGFDVLGLDISPDMIALARNNKERYGAERADFLVGDYEALADQGLFDAALFYDSLHHADDEELALRRVHASLRPGGICVISEPGAGHSRQPHSQSAIQNLGVNEKDMPPRHVIRLARKIGYTHWRVYPHTKPFALLSYGSKPGQPLFRLSRWPGFFRHLALAFYHIFRTRSYGLVVLHK